MQRDGATISLWQNNIPDYASGGTTSSTAVYDVLIAGGGITGVTTALLLQKAGKKVAIAEAHTLCFGTTGGTTAHINSFFDKSYDQVENDFGKESAQLISKATRQSRELFAKNVADYNIDCGFEKKDGDAIVIGPLTTTELGKTETYQGWAWLSDCRWI